MIDTLNYLEIDGIKYPFFCSLNTLEKIQTEYGSINDWDKKLGGNDESGNGEMNVAEVKKALTTMLNEGAEIKKGTELQESEILTEKQVGRLISEYGLKRSYELVQNQVSTCIYGKNAETTQNKTMEIKVK